MRRRQFLQLGVGGVAIAVAAPVWSLDPAGAATGAFRHGIASGDPLPDRVVLWTRVTPSDDASPGSGLGADTAVVCEVAEDEGFTKGRRTFDATARAASDHCVSVDADDLEPATAYWYRFRALGETSPVGRTRTLPATTASVDRLRFGVVSCSNWEGGYFSAYRHLAARDDLDLVLHLGDYVYEYQVGGYGPGPTLSPPRTHDPAVEMTTLEHYRRRHALYKTDPDLALLHRRYAFVTTIDDHEVADNSWSGGATNHTEPGEGPYAERRAAALRAYAEWMPIRLPDPDEPERIHRRFRLGDLVELFVLDERTHRSRPAQGASGDLFVTSDEPNDPDRTMLGPEQLDDLETGLAASAATWKVLANGVMFAPLVVGDIPDTPANAALRTALQTAGLATPFVLNGDQWDAYRAEQARLTTVFGEAGGVVVLTGDIHSSWAAEIPADPGAYLPQVGGATTAVEFVTPAVTSDSFSASIEGAGVPGAAQLAAALPTLVSTAGPWFKYLDPDRQGYGVFEVTPAAVQYDWHHISDRTDPQATSAHTASWRSPAGSNKLEEAAELGPRPVAPAPTATVAPAPTVPSGPTLPETGGHGLGIAAGVAVAAAVAARHLAGPAR